MMTMFGAPRGAPPRSGHQGVDASRATDCSPKLALEPGSLVRSHVRLRADPVIQHSRACALLKGFTREAGALAGFCMLNNRRSVAASCAHNRGPWTEV